MAATSQFLRDLVNQQRHSRMERASIVEVAVTRRKVPRSKKKENNQNTQNNQKHKNKNKNNNNNKNKNKY
jgi:hypothetical protein